jgi:hypothetical protein
MAGSVTFHPSCHSSICLFITRYRPNGIFGGFRNACRKAARRVRQQQTQSCYIVLAVHLDIEIGFLEWCPSLASLSQQQS